MFSDFRDIFVWKVLVGRQRSVCKEVSWYWNGLHDIMCLFFLLCSWSKLNKFQMTRDSSIFLFPTPCLFCHTCMGFCRLSAPCWGLGWSLQMGLLHMGQTLRISSHFTKHLERRWREHKNKRGKEREREMLYFCHFVTVIRRQHKVTLCHGTSDLIFAARFHILIYWLRTWKIFFQLFCISGSAGLWWDSYITDLFFF